MSTKTTSEKGQGTAGETSPAPLAASPKPRKIRDYDVDRKMAKALADAQRRERFVYAFCELLEPRKAARKAGYVGDGMKLSILGCQLLKDPEIVAKIKERHADICRELRIDATFVLASLQRIASFDARELYDKETGELRNPTTYDADTARVISGFDVEEREVPCGKDGATMRIVKTKVRLCSRDNALEKLGKRLKLFHDELNVGLDIKDFDKAVSRGMVRARQRAQRKE